MFSAEEVERMQAELQKCQIKVKSISDPLDKLWTDRPPMPEAPAFIYETQYAGKSSIEKIAIIRKELKKCNAKALFLSVLTKISHAGTRRQPLMTRWSSDESFSGLSERLMSAA